MKTYIYTLIVALGILLPFSSNAQDLRLLFEDDFKDNSNKWTLRSGSDLLETIEKNNLIIHTVNPKYSNRTENYFQFDEKQDFRIETKIEKLDGDNSRFYGLTWGCAPSNYHAFLISESGLFVVVSCVENKNEYHAKWKKFDKIAQNADILAVQRLGNKLEFYINKTKVFETKYLDFWGYRHGIFASPELIVQVDYIKFFSIKKQTIVQTNKSTDDDYSLQAQTAGMTVKFKPVNINLSCSVLPETAVLSPKLEFELRQMPSDSAYFNSYNFAEVKARQKENLENQVLMGDALRIGWDMKEPNIKRAIRTYERAAADGENSAYQRIAYTKYSLTGTEPNAEKFLTNLTEAANRNYADAQYDLALLHLYGNQYNVPKDWQITARWLEIYYKTETDPLKISQALTILGRMHYHQDAQKYGITPDLVMATQYFRKAEAMAEIDTLNLALNTFSKLRFILENNPEYLNSVNTKIDYTDFRQVKKLYEQLIANTDVFSTENLQLYTNCLKENVLYANFSENKNNNDNLLILAEEIKHENWLKPYNQIYVENIYNQVPLSIDFRIIEQAKKYSEFFDKNKDEVRAQKIRQMAVFTLFENSKNNTNDFLEFTELMFRSKWLRNEVMNNYDAINSAFEQICISDKQKDLNTQSDLFKPKGEFEPSTDYASRQREGENFKRQLEEKYADYEKKFFIQKIKFSHEAIKLSVEKIGTYDADKQLFPITINGFTDKVNVPLEHAPQFKTHINEIEVLAEKQLKEDGQTWQIFNVKIRNPITGDVYPFGNQQDPLYLDFVTEDDGKGIPNLSASIEFIEPSGNNILDAKEKGQLILKLKNAGTGFARNLNISVSTDSLTKIPFEKFKTVNSIAPQEEIPIYFPLNAPKEINNGKVEFIFMFTENKGFQPAPIRIKIPTQEYKEPKLVFVEAGIHENGNGNNIIENGEIIDVSALIQNRGQGKAFDTRVNIEFRDQNIINLTPEQASQRLGTIDVGESVKINFSFVVNNNYSGDNLLPIFIAIKESEGMYGQTSTVGLEMKKISLVATSIKVDGQYSSNKIIEEASLLSDIDKNIPESQLKNQNRYALVIGNEDYTKYQRGLHTESNVDFARNDAITFALYAEKTLGIPKDNIFLKTDAIGSVMEVEIEKLSKISQYNPEAEIFFYYAGHGFPDETTKESYIMPVDISGSNVKAGIKLADLYEKLTRNKPKKITVFLDACFSGGGRNQGLLAARAIKIKPQSGEIIGNIIVFSASSGEQSSLPYKDKKHGMFTYFLLKKMQTTAGNVNYKDLFEYVRKEVQLNSVIKNSKEQDPELNFSRDLLDSWHSWSLQP